MPDPVWTYQYNTAQTPENNGFTREIKFSPILTITTSGSPGGRGVMIDSTNGEVIFKTSNVPAFDSTVGITAEVLVSVTGNAEGDAGFEGTFLDRFMAVQIYPAKVLVFLAGNQELVFNTPSNAAELLWRLTYAAGLLAIYRAGILVAGGITVPSSTHPFQRFLWWTEGGAIATYKALKYYQGGAVPPG